MVVTIITYNTIFTQGYNDSYYYGTIRNIYAKSLNAFIKICKYLHKFASCMVLFNVFFTGFVKTWAYKQEMKFIAQIVTQFTYSQITGDISTATRLYWKIVVSAKLLVTCYEF